MNNSENQNVSQIPPLEGGEAKISSLDGREAIAIFASGAGSNAKVILEAAQNNDVHYSVALIVTNKPNAGVLEIAAVYAVPTLIMEKEVFFNGDAYVPILRQYNIQLIVLAGFLWKVPTTLIAAFNKKIINIHPSLLPKYGGKGMYGSKVHEAVIANKEIESGITIHYVNEVYDDGEIIIQAKCPIMPTDSAEQLAEKIHQLEYAHYWKVVNELAAIS